MGHDRQGRGVSACLVLLCLACVSVAAGRPQLKFLKRTELPHVGLDIRLMPDATETPLPSPQAYVYAGKDEEFYSPHELWRLDEHAGRWEDSYGNVLVIAKVTRLLPDELKSRRVTREGYRAVMEAAGTRTTWTSDELVQWVTDYTGASRIAIRPVSKRPRRYSYLFAIQMANGPPGVTAYFFRLSRTAAGQRYAPDNWFYVMFKVNPEINAERAAMAINEQFLERLTSSVTSTGPDTGTIEPSETFQGELPESFAGRSPEYVASVKQVADSIRNMKGWWYVVTDNYIILSNLASRYRGLVKDLQENAEAIRPCYAAILPPRTPVDTVSVIRIPGTPEEYVRYVGRGFGWTGGLWAPNRRELIINPMDVEAGRQQRERVLRVTYHEGSHQYLFYALGKQQAGPWFNEGYACFFENARFRGNRITIEEDEKRAKIIEAMLEAKAVNLGALLKLSYKELHALDDKVRNAHYGQAWALVYYLEKGAPARNPEYGEITDRYLAAIWETRDHARATQAAFQGVNLGRFQKDYIAFWSSGAARSRARRNRIFVEEQ